jgi:hypothetical protein
MGSRQTAKGELHLYINRFHNRFSDYFSYCATYAGGEIAVVLIVVALLFVKYRFALLVAVANISTSLFAQSLKDFVRPWVKNY